MIECASFAAESSDETALLHVSPYFSKSSTYSVTLPATS
jgi:hypothetical protein